MWTIIFVAFMVFLIKINKEKWWLGWFMLMGVAAQCGYKVGIVGMIVWIGISKVAKDIYYATPRY